MASIYYQKLSRGRCPCGGSKPPASVGIYVHGKYRKCAVRCPDCIGGTHALPTILPRPSCSSYPELESAFARKVVIAVTLSR